MGDHARAGAGVTVITLPSNLRIGVGSGVGQQRYDVLSASDSNGTQQARLLGPPRWTLALQQPPEVSIADAGVWQSLLVRLRGRVNVLAAWDPGRPVPRGTMRGTLTLSSMASLGATSSPSSPCRS